MEKINLDKQATFELYRQGKDVWNRYMSEQACPVDIIFDEKIEDSNFESFVFTGMAEFSGCSFEKGANFTNADFQQGAIFFDCNFKDGSIFQLAQFQEQALFSASTFHGLAYFNNTIFKQRAEFNEVKFLQTVYFENSTFNNDCYFDSAEFNSNSYFRFANFNQSAFFSSAQFKKMASFSEANFYVAYFDRASFEQLPIFYETNFLSVPDFLNTQIPSEFLFAIKISYSKAASRKFWEIGKAASPQDVLSYRILKQHAIESKDHDKELQYFAYEQMSKRWYSIRSPLSIGLSLTYEIFSNFGMSIIRPIFGLIMSCFLCSYSYMSLAINKSWPNAFVYTISNILPFGIIGRNSPEIHNSLFLASLPWVGIGKLQFYSTLFANSILGFIFLFLIGLGLRNRFKL